MIARSVRHGNGVTLKKSTGGKVNVLILGITGFAGTSMYNLLKQQHGIDLYGTFRHSTHNRNISGHFNAARLLEYDVNDVYSGERVLSEVRPDVIFHFASYVSVFGSFKNPLPAFHTNIIGTANLLEAVKKIAPEVKILLPGSGEAYGKVPADRMPIREETPLHPTNPYSISKKVQEEIGFYYFNTHGLKIYFTRTFHYTGPGQPVGFVCADIAKQVVDVEYGRIKKVQVGNLEARRDFMDIRDVVQAYWTIINKGTMGEVYNVCSGSSISIREILNKLIKCSSAKHVTVVLDKNKLRPSDTPNFVGSNDKLKGIGWMSQYALEDSLRDVYKLWQKEARWTHPFDGAVH